MMSHQDLLSPRVSGQHGDAAARDPGPNAVRAGCQDDGYTRTEHETGAVGIGEEAKQLGQDVGRLEIRREKNVGIAGDLRVNSFGFAARLPIALSKASGPVEKGPQ
jgi:hypothetical protein